VSDQAVHANSLTIATTAWGDSRALQEIAMKPDLVFPVAAPIAAGVLSDGHTGPIGWGVLLISIIMVAARFTLELIRERHVHEEVTLILQWPQREASATMRGTTH
jgi:hypothetical protein